MTLMNKMKLNQKFSKVLFCILLFILFTNLKAQDLPFWNNIESFKKQDSIVFPTHYKTLFIGSSSFTFWKSIKKDLPEYEPLNRAFGGSTLLDVIRYRKDIIDKYNPERIVIYCGENDIASSDTITGTVVFDRFKLLYKHIRERFPTINIYYFSMKPSPSRWSMKERMLDGNRKIEKFCKKEKNVYFISIWDEMLLDSKPNPTLFIEDKLHMNSKGYEIWVQKIRKSIKI